MGLKYTSCDSSPVTATSTSRSPSDVETRVRVTEVTSLRTRVSPTRRSIGRGRVRDRVGKEADGRCEGVDVGSNRPTRSVGFSLRSKILSP